MSNTFEYQSNSNLLSVPHELEKEANLCAVNFALSLFLEAILSEKSRNT